MVSSQLNSHYLSNLTLVAVFEPKPTIVLDQGRYFSDLAKAQSGTVSTLSVPENAPFEVPRLLLAGEGVQINLALDRVAISISGMKKDETGATAEMAFEAPFLKAMNEVLRFLRQDAFSLQFFGMITSFRWLTSPSVETAKIAESLFRLAGMGARPDRAVVNFAFQLGELVQGHFINRQVRVFQQKTVEVAHGEEVSALRVDWNLLPAQEQGIEFIFDVNSRPIGVTSSWEADLRRIYEMTRSEACHANAQLSDLERRS